MVGFSRQTIDTLKEPARMHTNRSVLSRQYRIQQYASNSDAFKFFNHLTSSELLDAVEFKLPVYRERLFPPTETLSMFLAQALKPDRSCQSIVNDFTVKRLMRGLQKCSTKTGGYCKARKRLPLALVSGMARHSGRLIAAKSSDKWLWYGRRIKLVDGTTVTMPDTTANQASYPQQKGQEPGLGFPICRIVGVTCLLSGAVLNAAMGGFKGKGSGEQALLRTLLDTFEPGDLMLGDAFYATYFLLAELQARKIDGLFEQHGARKRSTDFSKGEELGSRDHLITLIKPKIRPDWMTVEQYISAPDTLIVRELKVGGKVLVTTLTCPKTISKIDLKDLFKLRWNVELDIRNIKTTLGMETFSCKTPEMCEKEMWVYFLGYNLIRLIMAESALLADVLPRTLSFKHTVQLWLAWDGISKPTGDLANIGKLLALVSEKSVGKRPGRVEPRAIKRRPKPYPLLMENRTLAREKVKLHGHPKKLK